jgi:hypothetical protein
MTRWTLCLVAVIVSYAILSPLLTSPAAAAGMTEAGDRGRDSVVTVHAAGGSGGSVSVVGAGVVVNTDGSTITCGHVIKNATTVEVTLADGSKTSATVQKADEALDLAILKVARANLPAAQFASSATIERGAQVAAIGSPLGLENSLTTGVVSAPVREINGRKYIQIDAALNQGSSGGPVINDKGQVVGIAAVIAKQAEKVGFAIPADVVVRFLQANGVAVQMALGEPSPPPAGGATGVAPAPEPTPPAAVTPPATPTPPVAVEPEPKPSGPGWVWVILLPIIIAAIVSALTTFLLSRYMSRSTPVTNLPGVGPARAAQPPRQEDLSDVDIDLL